MSEIKGELNLSVNDDHGLIPLKEKKMSIAKLLLLGLVTERKDMNIQVYTRWSQEKQENLIDAIFHDKKFTPIVVNQDKEILDGRQIYLTISDFVHNRLQFQGKWFSEWGNEQQIIFQSYELDVKLYDLDTSGIKPFQALNE